jgi:hypothetical protein
MRTIKMSSAAAILGVLSLFGYNSAAHAQNTVSAGGIACTIQLVPGGSTVSINGDVETGESVKWSLWAGTGDAPDDFTTRFFVTSPAVQSVSQSGEVVPRLNNGNIFVEACINNVSSDTVLYVLTLSQP